MEKPLEATLMKQRTNRGFTLVELITVVAIVAILLAIGIPAFGNISDRQQLKSAIETFSSDMRRARSESIARGPIDEMQVMFTVTAADDWSYTVTSPTTGDTLVDRSSGDFGDVVTLSISTATDNFGGDRKFSVSALRALVSDGAGSVTFGIASESVQVSRNLMGRLSLCSATGALGYTGCS